MIRAILVLFVTCAVGCVTPIPFEEQTPTLSYTTPGTTLVSVIDERVRVAKGKPANFVGVAHGMFGIPASWHIHQVLNVEDGDKERDLAQFLRHRIVAGLRRMGWDVRALEQPSRFTEDEAQAALEREKADTLLTLVLHEWYFSLNLNWVSSFNFDTDTDVSVDRLGRGQIVFKKIAGRDVIDEEASQSPQNLILWAYREQLVEILSDDEIAQALSSR